MALKQLCTALHASLYQQTLQQCLNVQICPASSGNTAVVHHHTLKHILLTMLE